MPYRLLLSILMYCVGTVALAQQQDSVLSEQRQQKKIQATSPMDTVITQEKAKARQSARKPVTRFKQNVRAEQDSLPRLSQVKGRPDSELPLKKVNSYGKGISVDSTKADKVKHSYLDKGFQLESDGKNTTTSSPDAPSLSELRNLVSHPDIPKGSGDSLKHNLKKPDLSSPDLEKRARKTTDGLLDEKALKQNTAKIENLNEASALEAAKGQLPGVKKIYSEKLLKQLKDSLGVARFDSLFNVFSPLIKKEVSKDDFLEAVNKAAPGGTPLSKIDTDSMTIKDPDAEKLGAMANGKSLPDLSKLQLPDSVLSELAPLTGRNISNKYLDMVDSLRDINLKKEGLELEEKKINEDVKASIARKKPSFLDKSYAEGIIGFLKEDKITILQVSPAAGYHFTDYFSVGLGPSIQVVAEDKDLTTTFGFRTFTKLEFYKRKVYLQLEDDVKPNPIGKEMIRKLEHSVLFGGGALIPLWGSIGITPSLLYRIIDRTSNNNASPWVFRLGISTIKKK